MEYIWFRTQRLVEREARRRILFKVSRDHARDGKRRMSEGTYELREFDRNQRIFDRRADPRQLSGIAQNLSLPEAALGSMGGFTASQNARVASIFALDYMFASYASRTCWRLG